MSITDLFIKIGAPLVNQRWSWGAFRPLDGSVILRIWAEEIQFLNGKQFARISWISKFAKNQENLGYKERMKQIEEIKKGMSTFLVVCTTVDQTGNPRKIRSYNDKYLYQAGELINYNDDWWLEIVDKVNV